ncbi:hypothetical protein KC19_VG096700 [Ceratodon purpureus]|uniref:Uncharacterized protein n=1 Tax=Ceratodon purpureus TaxID=3225 RepID=A0A8T0HNW6_CERPU|nr:hypothetical protein KC19_VG096700 [Ceratodon purpureus]
MQTYGAKGKDSLHKLEELFTLPSNKKITRSLLQLMCSSNLTPDLEEEDLFKKQKEVKLALLEYQRHFLKDSVFYSVKQFMESSYLVPEHHIKVQSSYSIVYSS